MGVSRLTAFTIVARKDIVVDAGGPDKNGKYMGWITLGEEDRYRPLLNSEATYDTKEEAKAAMHQVVKGIRDTYKEDHGDADPFDVMLKMIFSKEGEESIPRT